MLFNSFTYFVFLPIVFLIYWFVFKKSIRLQNLFLLAVSYLFYGFWDWRFLSLIFISSVVDFSVGLSLGKTESQSKRNWLLGISLLTNLGFLFFFKYANFFIDSFVELCNNLNIEVNEYSLYIILPVGISFYTFQTLSYTIDIYKRQLEPTKDPVAFFAFVSFFPQLVAGPIERAKNLLSQFEVKREFKYDQATDGLRQILWGLFKKVAVADTCAPLVEQVFNNYSSCSGLVLILGATLFAFQIYCDFSGYSDIAIGSAKLLGFRLMQNFSTPYFSRDIGEFWRRWHISLSTWFRDYVYIPLGGSYGNKWSRIRNIIITFTVSGFWHGANWTFVFWGFINGLYYIPLMLLNKEKGNKDIVAKNRFLPSIKEVGLIVLTFLLTTLTWIFFRSEDITQAFGYIANIFSAGFMANPLSYFSAAGLGTPFLKGFLAIGIMLVIEWLQRGKEHSFKIELFRTPFRWSSYLGLLMLIYVLGNFESDFEFIYFQF